MRRFDRGGYLGLHLTVGIMVSLAALWLFAGVTEDIIHHDPVTRADTGLLNWFHQHPSAFGNRIFEAFGWVASPTVIISLAVLVFLFLLIRQDKLLASAWLATLLGSGIVDAAVKHIVQRPRPNHMDVFSYGPANSFPSGHALGALTCYGMLAYLLAVFWAKDWRARTAIVAAAVLLVTAVGFSRIYLGVHYFSDVIAGYAAGLVWLSVCITGVEIVRRKPKTSGSHLDDADDARGQRSPSLS